MTLSITTPAHPHTTRVSVYQALFKDDFEEMFNQGQIFIQNFIFDYSNLYELWSTIPYLAFMLSEFTFSAIFLKLKVSTNYGFLFCTP